MSSNHNLFWPVSGSDFAREIKAHANLPNQVALAISKAATDTNMNKITTLKDNEIFVFGSNLAGRHGKGAAWDALAFGAEYGEGVGRFGQTFAIPTKDENLKVMPLVRIGHYVAFFLAYAKLYPNQTFLVTKVGCGLAGYSPKEIAPLFKGATPNVVLPQEFLEVLQSQQGTQKP